MRKVPAWRVVLSLACISCAPVRPQVLLTTQVRPVSADLALLTSIDQRDSLPCKVSPVKPQVGLDLGFHSGYSATIPLEELSGPGSQLRLLMRLTPLAEPHAARYFADSFSVPPLPPGLHGEASFAGEFVLGPGRYKVDWLMRGRQERQCSAHWELEAKPADWLPKEVMPIPPNAVSECPTDPFKQASLDKRASEDRPLHVKLLVNFSPSDTSEVTLTSSELEAIVSIMRGVDRELRLGSLSLVAFSMCEEKVLFRQNDVPAIDFRALGKTVDRLNFGTVDYHRLLDPMSGARFLAGLLTKEVGGQQRSPDAIIIIGPKVVMRDKNNLMQTFRRAGRPNCPIFYLNCNSDPVRNPWRDALGATLRSFGGLEYAVTGPRDLAAALKDMRSRLSGLESRTDFLSLAQATAKR